MKSKIVYILQWAISLIALTYAVWNVDIAKTFTKTSEFSYHFISVALFFLALDYTTMGFRLQKIFHPAAPPMPIAIRATIICAGYNNILPAKAGDMLKVLFLAGYSKRAISEVLPFVIQERLYDFICLGIICLSTLYFAPLFIDTSFFAVGLLLIFCTIFIVIYFQAKILYVLSLIRHEKIRSIGINLFENFVSGITFKKFVLLLTLTGVIWLFYFISFYICIIHVGNIPLSLSQCAIVFCVTSMGMALPSSPGGLGVFEGAAVLSLSWFNVDAESALSIAVLTHCLYLIPVSLVAVFLKKKI